MKTFYTFFNKRNVLKVTFLAALGLLGTAGLQAQISGNYTIDRTGTASATVYEDFQSVIDDLSGNTRSDGGVSNNTGSGVTGHATFTVAAGSGPYTWASTDQLVIPDIASMSSTATVTFKGNDETINYTGTSSFREAIHLNGADWFRFDSLNIYSNRSSQAWGIRFSNNADDNIIENCEVRTPNVLSGTTSTTSGSTSIIFGSSTSTMNYSQWGTSGAGSNGNRNIIRNNSLGGRNNGTSAGGGPTHAIVIIGDDGDGTSNNLIQDNYIANYWYRSILMANADNNTIDGNEITSPNTTSNNNWGGNTGIYIDNWNSNASDPNTIINNEIHHNYGTTTSYTRDAWGIYVYDQGDGAGDISNNSIYDIKGQSTQYGINLGNSTSNTGALDCYHNTVNFDGNNTYSPLVYGIYSAVRAANADVKNNVINITQTGGSTTQARYGLFDRNWGSTTYDYNNVIVDRSGTGNPTSGDYYGNSGGPYNTLADWQASGRGANSSDFEPNFIDPANGDLRPLSFPLNNTGDNLGILTDINDSTRSVATPDKGAFEIKIDASVTAFPWTNLSVCGGFEDSVRITIKNENTFAISDIPVAFWINSAVRNEVIAATIAPGASYNYTFTRTAVFNSPGTNTFTAGVGVDDDNTANNTMSHSVLVTAAPSGSVLTNNNTGTPATGDPIHNFNAADVTVPGAVLDYTFSAPPNNVSTTYAAYGSDWTASSVLRTKVGQTVVTGNIDMPGANDINITVDPPMAYTDSLLELCVTFVDVATGCDSTYCKDILVAPRGVPSFVFPVTVCDGEGVLFDNFSTVSSGFLLYEWTFFDATKTTVHGTANSTNPVFTFPGPGDYVVRQIAITDPHGYQDTLEQTVTVTPIPTVNFTRINKCEGEDVILTNTTTPISSNFTWDFGDGSPTVSTVNATKAYAPGGYAVTLTAEKNGCSAEITKNVYQFARPVANASLASGSCSNEEFTFNNLTTISVGNTGYLWDFDEPNAISTDAMPSYTFQTPGVKNIRLKSVSEFGCEDTLNTPLVITVKEAPKAQFTYTSDGVMGVACSETASLFNNTSTTPTGATNNYHWTFEGNRNMNNNSSLSHNWTVLGPQTVILEADADNGCSDVLTEEVNVLIQPVADFALADVCEGETVQLTNLTTWPAGDISYNWNIPLATPSVSTDGAPTVTVTAAPGNQIVTLTATIAGGCSSIKNIPVEIKEKPSTCNFTIDADFANGIRNYDLMPNGGATTGIDYKWVYSFGGSDLTTGMGKQDVTFPNGTGNVTVTMIATKNGCECSSSQSLALTDVETLPNGGTFKVFPNPTEGNLNVEIANNSEELTIEVFNAVGVQVATVNTNEATNGTFNVDLNGLSSGLYLVRVKVGKEVTTQRVTLTK